MLRIVTLAALAAAIAAPAGAAEIRVSTVGKSAEQISAEVSAAARTVCLRETTGETFRLMALDSCQRATVKAALAQISDPQVAAAAGQKLAQR